MSFQNKFQLFRSVLLPYKKFPFIHSLPLPSSFVVVVVVVAVDISASMIQILVTLLFLILLYHISYPIFEWCQQTYLIARLYKAWRKTKESDKNLISSLISNTLWVRISWRVLDARVCVCVCVCVGAPAFVPIGEEGNFSHTFIYLYRSFTRSIWLSLSKHGILRQPVSNA